MLTSAICDEGVAFFHLRPDHDITQTNHRGKPMKATKAKESRSFLCERAISHQRDWQSAQDIARAAKHREADTQAEFRHSLEELAMKEPDTINKGGSGAWFEHHLRNTLGWSSQEIAKLRAKGAKQAVSQTA
jgi:hypothetical protein